MKQKTNHRKEIDKDMMVTTYDEVAVARDVGKDCEGRWVFSAHDVGELWCEDEGGAVALEALPLFCVAEDVAKVDVEEVAGAGEEDVVVVAVADA